MTGTGNDRLAAYLQRIELSERPSPDPAGLELLQRAHRLAIPFENLDIRLGRQIHIDSDSVFEKLVTRRRGGYCFEQNRLFSDMLVLAGLPNRPLLARVHQGSPSAEPPPRTHVLLLADIAGESWIADAGFGGSYVAPLRLTDGATATAPDGIRHRLRRVGEPGSLAGEWMVERLVPGGASDWQAQYGFDVAEVAASDLALANHWTSTAPTSRFLGVHMVTITLPFGFASMIDRSVSVWENGSDHRTDIDDVDAYRETLASRFRLPMSESDLAALPLFA